MASMITISDLKSRFPRTFQRIINNWQVSIVTFHDDRVLIINLLNCENPLVFTADQLDGIEAVLR